MLLYCSILWVALILGWPSGADLSRTVFLHSRALIDNQVLCVADSGQGVESQLRGIRKLESFLLGVVGARRDCWHWGLQKPYGS
jgi:hypothetical protein